MDRLQLQAKLEQILGSRNVYFQPPPTIQLQYPCIIYEMARPYVIRADDDRYQNHKAFSLTVIDANPDTDIYERIMNNFPYSSFDRAFKSDNLNHFAISIYI